MAKELTEDDVLQILDLIEKSHFDFLQLELGDLKLTVSKGGGVPFPRDQASPKISSDPGTSGTTKDEGGEAEGSQSEGNPEPRGASPEGAVVEGDTHLITAPMVGTIYLTPEPGARPYVEVAQLVDEDTTVGLIEVMKVFTAVTARVRGIIAEVCVQNDQFVEFGQILFRVKPE